MTRTARQRIPTPPECISLIHALAGTRVKLIRQRAELDAQLREVSNQLDRLDWQISSIGVSEEWLTSVARHPSNRIRQENHRSTGA